jgi:16S rRNA processing protein RimM
MDTPRWDDLVTVARIARPHGLRGDVILNPETDFAEERFVPGARFFVLEGARIATLTVRRVWFHRDRPVVGFEGIDTIEEAQPLAGRDLRITEDALQPLPPGVYYHHDLVGCRVETADGAEVGVVRKVDGSGEATRLVVVGAAGEVLIPLAVEICPTIDPGGRRIVVAAVDGLLDVNVTRGRRAGRGRRW